MKSYIYYNLVKCYQRGNKHSIIIIVIIIIIIIIIIIKSCLQETTMKLNNSMQ